MGCGWAGDPVRVTAQSASLLREQGQLPPLPAPPASSLGHMTPGALGSTYHSGWGWVGRTGLARSAPTTSCGKMGSSRAWWGGHGPPGASHHQDGPWLPLGPCWGVRDKFSLHSLGQGSLVKYENDRRHPTKLPCLPPGPGPSQRGRGVEGRPELLPKLPWPCCFSWPASSSPRGRQPLPHGLFLQPGQDPHGLPWAPGPGLEGCGVASSSGLSLGVGSAPM